MENEEPTVILSEATNPDALQVLIHTRKARAAAIQKAQKIMAAHPDRLEAAAEAQKAFDTGEQRRQIARTWMKPNSAIS